MRPGDFTERLQVGEKARQDSIYVPYLNRWSQPDTIVPSLGNPQSLNRYAYVYGNPVKVTDPSGHDPGCQLYLDNQCVLYQTTSGTTSVRDISITPTEQEIQIWLDEILGEEIESSEEGLENLRAKLRKIKEHLQDKFWELPIHTTWAIGFSPSFQTGIGTEVGLGFEAGLTCNWVAGECSVYYEGIQLGYFGTPNFFSLNYLSATISSFQGATSTSSIGGSGSFFGGSLGIDTLPYDISVGGGYVQSTVGGAPFDTFIDPLSNKPVKGEYLTAAMGVDAGSTIVSAGLYAGTTNTLVCVIRRDSFNVI
jgi:RHS repeat-associated protein